MRLFVAIALSREIRERLDGVIDALQSCCESGRATQSGNLHLTLAFLGETAPERIGRIREAVDRVSSPPFFLHIGGIGYFRREGGDIFWAGVERSEALTGLHRQLYSALQERGFPLEKRSFRPHLTLMRQAVLKQEYDHSLLVVPAMKMRVETIRLMKSERPGGRLVYTPLYVRSLAQENGK